MTGVRDKRGLQRRLTGQEGSWKGAAFDYRIRVCFFFLAIFGFVLIPLLFFIFLFAVRVFAVILALADDALNCK